MSKWLAPEQTFGYSCSLMEVLSCALTVWLLSGLIPDLSSIWEMVPMGTGMLAGHHLTLLLWSKVPLFMKKLSWDSSFFTD
jgi:hypothetical protein